MNEIPQPLAPGYQFYHPEGKREIRIGAEERLVPLAQIPLPIECPASASLLKEPGDKEIGASVYSYLRRFPDCPYAREYAQLLREAFPYYLAEIGAEIIMLEAKDVDPPYIKRKINSLKILRLLDPRNPQLLHKLGMAYFELGLIYVELIHVRRNLGHALNFLHQAQQLAPEDISILNLLGQISYLLGDYPAVLRYWQGVIDQIPQTPAAQQLSQRLKRIQTQDVPQHPLIEDLEAVGIAAEHFSAQEYAAASEIMDRLEEQGSLPKELPMAEFYYLLALCREKNQQQAAAFEGFQRALELHPDWQAAQEGLDRVTG